MRSETRCVLRTVRGLLIGLALILIAGAAGGYPIDAFETTGIGRLEGYRLINEGQIPGGRLPPGALLPRDQIWLRLTHRPDFEIPEPDKTLTQSIVDLLGDSADRYSISVLDLSDPDAPAYAEHRGWVPRNPGSVGKLMVAVALFQALADRYPDDIGARQRLLRQTQVTADRFNRHHSHDVPIWLPERNRLLRRPLREGDTANLWTYLDWMLSASSNAAASTVIQQLVLLRHFGEDYPVESVEAQAALRDMPRSERHELLVNSLLEPLARNGLDTDRLRQGAFFTREARRWSGGTTSVSTVRELMRLLVMMEKGELVDAWSSLELKRLLYITQRRIRYASSPALSDAAVYFKSGSLYKCDRNENPDCGKYRGNVYNYMNSVAIVEAPAGDPRLFYLVVITSNVLDRNAAVEHQTFATRLHRLLKARQSAPSSP